jgi:hypothetical protein
MDKLFKFIFLAGLTAFHAALMWVIWDKFPAPLPERVFFQVTLGLVGIGLISFIAMEMDD